MGFLSFLVANPAIITGFMNIFANAAHSQPTPDAAAAALQKAASDASVVYDTARKLVMDGEDAAINFANAPTGLQKLAVAQAAVQAAHNIAVSSGVTTESFDAVWNPISAAITAICEARKMTSTAS